MNPNIVSVYTHRQKDMLLLYTSSKPMPELVKGNYSSRCPICTKIFMFSLLYISTSMWLIGKILDV